MMRRDDRFKTRDLRNLEHAVIGKLAAEGLTVASPWVDVERCLAKTVSPALCIEVARRLRVRHQEGRA